MTKIRRINSCSQCDASKWRSWGYRVCLEKHRQITCKITEIEEWCPLEDLPSQDKEEEHD